MIHATITASDLSTNREAAAEVSFSQSDSLMEVGLSQRAGSRKIELHVVIGTAVLDDLDRAGANKTTVVSVESTSIRSWC